MIKFHFWIVLVWVSFYGLLCETKTCIWLKWSYSNSVKLDVWSINGDYCAFTIFFFPCARMAATMHAKMNRRNLDQINLIRIWLSLLLSSFLALGKFQFYWYWIFVPMTVKKFWIHQYQWRSGFLEFLWVLHYCIAHFGNK